MHDAWHAVQVMTSKEFMQCVTAVDPEWLAELVRTDTVQILCDDKILGWDPCTSGSPSWCAQIPSH